jgi:hypothetical protein
MTASTGLMGLSKTYLDINTQMKTGTIFDAIS